MFRIGEFAQIAQVSGRQLRYYDQLGLLTPARIDGDTGYRYYSASQLPRLNAILALKDLGLTLEEIGPLLAGDLPAAEMRGMLTLKRAELTRNLRQEAARLRHIESRIAQIDDLGDLGNFDVVVKSAEPAPYLSLRNRFDDLGQAFAAVGAVVDGALRQLRPALRDRLVVVSWPDPDDDRLDLEIGFTLTRPTNARVSIAGGDTLSLGELPAAPRLATLVRRGPPYESHHAFGVIGAWMEAHGCEVDGPCREVFLEPVTGVDRLPDALVEIQFPIRAAA
jgi:DNA-binding transcriptional MerR regulator